MTAMGWVAAILLGWLLLSLAVVPAWAIIRAMLGPDPTD